MIHFILGPRSPGVVVCFQVPIVVALPTTCIVTIVPLGSQKVWMGQKSSGRPCARDGEIVFNYTEPEVAQGAI